MKTKDYTQLLTNKDKLRIFFVEDRGKIKEFVVQYYSLIDSRWRTIIRIDNHHGYPHRHTYHLRRKEYRVVLNKDANLAFTESKADIIKNFEKIKENYIFAK